MAVEDVIEGEMKSYPTPMERAAYRAGMSTAALICDRIKSQVETSNTSRGRVTVVGRAMADVAKVCGDEIWIARERVTTD